MNIVFNKRNLFLSMFLISGILFSQEKNPLGSETVIVVKPYAPSVDDALKIKETPKESDSLDLEKKPVEYSIFSVPVASTFTPAKGRATNVERAKPIKVYDNYATLGLGNYTNALAEFYSSLEVNRTDNFGVFLTHNSSQGGIDEVVLDDKFYNTELNLNYNSKNRDFGWDTEAGLQHQLFNWYGLAEPNNFSNQEIVSLDPAQQNYYSAYVAGEIDMYDSFLENAEAQLRYFGDAYQSAENNFDAQATFELNIADELITTNISADILNGKFDRSYFDSDEISYNYMNFGISPSLLILRDDLTLNLGAAFFYSLDTENNDNSFHLYPKITASYRMIGDYFTPYAGIEGELQQNTYHSFVQKNPYVSPTLTIMPTDRLYDAYVGVKGKLSNNASYNIRGSYESEFNRAIFRRNAMGAINNNEDYTYGNSFEVVYDDVNTLSFFGELSVDVNRDFTLTIDAEYFNYSTDIQEKAWNLPDLKASLNVDYQITEKWYSGANAFYVGERTDQARTFTTVFLEPVNNSIALESYFDLNAHLGYRFNDQLSAFVKGRNLLNNDYEHWTNFQVQGLQVLAGATYKFDF